MTYVVGDNCVKCKYTDCVEVCPADCFHEGPNFLVINPETCVDCDQCPSECPAEAIYREDNVPDAEFEYIQLNAELAQHWPIITAAKKPLADAEQWDGKENKLVHLLDWDDLK